jgi:hypothetical protein
MDIQESIMWETGMNSADIGQDSVLEYCEPQSPWKKGIFCPGEQKWMVEEHPKPWSYL